MIFNPLSCKLELFGRLGEGDRQLVDAVVKKRRSVPAKTSIIQEGDAPDDVHLVFSGLACRSKLLPTGRRQIFAYLLLGHQTQTCRRILWSCPGPMTRRPRVPRRHRTLMT
jgi:hypothetical protein